MSTPTLKWGIIGTGLISSWFVLDLTLDRSDAKAVHKITAVGASSVEKGEKFISEYKLGKPFIGSYDEVYKCEDVDIIYIGLPHVFHKESAIKAMAAGKHVLVEKPACVNAKDFKEMVEAAKKYNVFLMEAMWLRFRPMILELQKLLLEDKELGEVYRLIGDFAMDMGLEKLPSDSRVKNVELGAGALLDIGIYPFTFARALLDPKVGTEHTPFEVKSFQNVRDKIDYASDILLKYESGPQAILSCSVWNKTPDDFLRVDCEKGTVVISGPGSSIPIKYRIEYKEEGKENLVKDFPAFNENGWGFFYEADAVALDIAAGKIQSDIMPWAETVLVLETMDEIRKQGGVIYPQDK